MIVFLLSPQGRIYGRYGGREFLNAPLSLAGLKYSMQAALDAHRDPANRSAPADRATPRFIRQFAAAEKHRGCIHCHQVQEILYDDLKSRGLFKREMMWRYPPPENLGLTLERDRGDVVERVVSGSAAERTGLQRGDVIQLLDGQPVHSLADAQYTLDRAPMNGSITVTWRRGNQEMRGALELAEGWRRTDATWRSSLRAFIPSARVFGRDLKEQEKRALGLSSKQLAFHQLFPVSTIAQAAGIRDGDIILGFDGRVLEMTAYEFLGHVRRNYMVGDRVTVNLIRDGQRLELPMTLR